MSAAEVLRVAQAAGVDLRVDGEALVLEAAAPPPPDALMALCDRLEASLTATAGTRRRLLDALLAEALATADDRELEAAE